MRSLRRGRPGEGRRRSSRRRAGRRRGATAARRLPASNPSGRWRRRRSPVRLAPRRSSAVARGRRSAATPQAVDRNRDVTPPRRRSRDDRRTGGAAGERRSSAPSAPLAADVQPDRRRKQDQCGQERGCGEAHRSISTSAAVAVPTTQATINRVGKPTRDAVGRSCVCSSIAGHHVIRGLRLSGGQPRMSALLVAPKAWLRHRGNGASGRVTSV